MSTAVEELFRRHGDRLRRRIRWMLGAGARRAADSGDFVGDVMARILARGEEQTWRDEEHFVAYATRVARNLVVDERRRRSMRRFDSFTASLSAGRLPDEAAPGPEQAAARDEDVDRLLAAMEQLDRDHQRVIELRDYEGLSMREIAATMGRSANAVQILRQRALTRLGMLLERARSSE